MGTESTFLVWAEHCPRYSRQIQAVYGWEAAEKWAHVTELSIDNEERVLVKYPNGDIKGFKVTPRKTFDVIGPVDMSHEVFP
jgi:hypothetical protein